MTGPMAASMQDYALTVDRFLVHAAKWHGSVEVVSAEPGGVTRKTYAETLDRSRRLSGALLGLGLRPGDRIGTLAWNTRHHLEMWYGTMGVGMICHTLNPRLTIDHLALMIDQAQDRILCIGAGLTDMGRALTARCPSLEKLIILDGDPVEPGDIDVEALIAGSEDRPIWGDFDEQTPAGLCFTSGTTGAPKGVLYTHRSNYLNTIRSLQADCLALTRQDVALVTVPMFHANAWGFPFSAPSVGSTLVLPGRMMDGASLARLIQDEGVTVTAGVPTVWIGLLDHVEANDLELPTLQRIILGGAGAPESLIRRMEDRLGVRVQTSWGMTELSPMGTLSPPAEPAVASGRPAMGLDMLLTDATGAPLPDQRNRVGHLKVKGPSVARQYYDAASPAIDADGWFDTGDLAIIDDSGALTLAGRSKDLIKSGGEWINPVEIEDIIGSDPAIGLVAVIGRFDPKWGERPLLVVEPRQGHAVEDGALLKSLKGRVADWWIPDRVVQVGSMPLASTGKIDKTALRALYGAA
ncbi:N/A [soil metagenome]